MESTNLILLCGAWESMASIRSRSLPAARNFFSTMIKSFPIRKT